MQLPARARLIPRSASTHTCKADKIYITGFVASVDGTKMLVESITGSRNQAEALGKALADQLRAKGADKILALLD